MNFVKECTFYYVEIDSDLMQSESNPLEGNEYIQDSIISGIEDLNCEGEVECFFDPYYRLNISITSQSVSDGFILGKIENIISNHLK
jgi:hypothetical protein